MHAVKHRMTSPPWLARTAGVGLSSVSIGFVGLFLFVLESGGEVTLFTRPLVMEVALVLPYFIGILTLGTTAGALLAWRYQYWSLPVRIHQTVLALLGIAFSWQLVVLGFIAL
ncbi:hypothetical protein ATJ93_4714 [Halopiger aswanensis]|uniref:Uncharacterized protein n=1 Tax=Halopiger aswanensis TaxID=148449 RepID=A0A3R7DWC2_9EURY|nr:hypothetical protein ATJ93_4714 [Halopiger aswanensis]